MNNEYPLVSDKQAYQKWKESILVEYVCITGRVLYGCLSAWEIAKFASMKYPPNPGVVADILIFKELFILKRSIEV